MHTNWGNYKNITQSMKLYYKHQFTIVFSNVFQICSLISKPEVDVNGLDIVLGS